MTNPPGTPLLTSNLAPFFAPLSSPVLIVKTQAKLGGTGGLKDGGVKGRQGRPLFFFNLRGSGRTRDRRDGGDAARWPSVRSKRDC